MIQRLVLLSLALAATLASQTPSDELRQHAREALDAAASTAGATEPGFQAPALLDIAKLLADSDPKAEMETLGVASAAASGKAKGLAATAYLEPVLDPYRQTLARMEFARAWLGQDFTFGMTMRGVPVDQR
jgi:hypothetical protein